MASLYTDNDVSVHLAAPLQSRGHQVTTAQALGLAHAEDAEQLLVAAQRRWTLVTHNRGHFVVLHQAWWRWPQAWQVTSLPEHAGILVLDQQPVAALVEALLGFLAPVPPLVNELYWWRLGSGWQRWHVGSGWARWR